MLGSHRKGYLFTQHRMESGGYRKGFPKEVISKLGTKRQVRICPAKAGGGLSRMTAGGKGPQAKLLVHRVKHKRREERCRPCRPGYGGRRACQGKLLGKGDFLKSLPALKG